VEVTPILNVSDLQASFEWFAKLGWEKGWDWGPPDADSPTFGAVKADDHEIFLCVDGQGGRGEHGVWLSLWLDDVDAVYATCAREGFDVISAPENKPWNVREMHVRHPDGHVLRVSSEAMHERR